MRSLEEVKKRLKEYSGVDYIYTENGYIAWQCSTGENYEILFIETREPRKGYGKNLLREMCKKIKPFHSVFVFRLYSNIIAGEFYRSIGFKETIIPDLYNNTDAVLAVINYEKLCQNLSIK